MYPCAWASVTPIQPLLDGIGTNGRGYTQSPFLLGERRAVTVGRDDMLFESTECVPAMSATDERQRLRGIDVLEGLVLKRQEQWDRAQSDLSDRCLGWLNDSKFATPFFCWLGQNPGLLAWVARTGKREAAQGYRVSIPLIYELLRSRGAKEVARQKGGQFSFGATLQAPLGWAFSAAYPELALDWGLKLDGPRNPKGPASA
jgi:hypothetical protein